MNIFIKTMIRSWITSGSQLRLHDYIDKYLVDSFLNTVNYDDGLYF